VVWIPVAAWIAAQALAIVVLGCCAYEIYWKSRRLRTELAGLRGSADALTLIQARASVLAEDAARVRTGIR
jgi:hypothetical protein